jgi:hypothetical protein
MIRVHQIPTHLRSPSDCLGEITLRSSTLLIGDGVSNRTVVIGSTPSPRTNVSGTSYQDHRRLQVAYQYHRSYGEVAGLQLRDKRLTPTHFLRAQLLEGKPNSSPNKPQRVGPLNHGRRLTTTMDGGEDIVGAGRRYAAGCLRRSPSSPTSAARTTRSERDERGAGVRWKRAWTSQIWPSVRSRWQGVRCGCSLTA